jgi:hypothetical protein
MSSLNQCGCESCDSKPCACGCCEGTQTHTPATPYNRPALPSLSYRVGTHGQFLESMKARLSSSDYSALANLRTRDPSDFSIALLDSWATVGDVLSFYQERIATEGYLRTATERRSVLELARLIGYSPRPGVSASVYLAYTLDKDQNVTIAKGNRAQSVPGPGELPQSFETSEHLEARVELNVMKPRSQRPQYFALQKEVTADITTYKGTIGNTLYFGGIVSTLKTNDILLLDFGGKTLALLSVMDVVLEASLNRTKVTVELRDPTHLESEDVTENVVVDYIHKMAGRFTNAAKFGVPPNAGGEAKALLESLRGETDVEKLLELLKTVLPQLKSFYAVALTKGQKRITAWLAEAVTRLEAVFKNSPIERPVPRNGKTSTPLATIVEGLRKRVSLQPANDKRLERDIVALYSENSDVFPNLYSALYPSITDATYQALAEVPARQRSPLQTLEALRVKAAFFGHNAPPKLTTVQAPEFNGEFATGKQIITQIEAYPTLADAWHDLYSEDFPLNMIALDGEYETIKEGHWLVIKRPRVDGEEETNDTLYRYAKVEKVEVRTLSVFSFSAKVTLLTLSNDWLPDVDDVAFSRLLLTMSRVYAAGEILPLADETVEREVTGDETYLELDSLYQGLEAGRWVIVEGERSDILNTKSSSVIAAELAMISEVIHGIASIKTSGPVQVTDRDALPGDTLHTFIRFAESFEYKFKRDTVKIYGNVVKATHGETKLETLGAGAASKSFQTFALKQPPLTYLPAATAAGAESTLELRVNGVKWHEAPYLAGLTPSDRRYQIRSDDDGKTSVVFGNGKQGSRLPTGLENVSATYRSGLGKSGNVAANKISLLTTKPLGVKEVINPLAATGGADRESRDSARKNAPKMVKALDRLVSVQDYADFVESFAGIAKASATEISYGGRSVVHVTVAGIDDIVIDKNSDLHRNLYKALLELGDPYQAVELALRELRLLVIEARVRILPDYLWEEVEPRLRAAILNTFGFDKRELGQDVLQAEALSTLQLVKGVAYVDLETLASLGDEELSGENITAGLGKAKRIPVHAARLSTTGTAIAPAQLAILSPQVKDTLILTVIP